MNYKIKIKKSESGTKVFKFDSAMMPLKSTWASELITSLESFDELMEKISDGKSLVMYADVGLGLPFLIKEMVNKTKVDQITITAHGKSHGFVGRHSVTFKNVAILACLPLPTPEGLFSTPQGPIPKGLFQLCTFEFEETE